MIEMRKFDIPTIVFEGPALSSLRLKSDEVILRLEAGNQMALVEWRPNWFVPMMSLA